MPLPRQQSGFLYQGNFGTPGNFELVAPGAGGVAHFWRDNGDPTLPWRGSEIFDRDQVDAATVIQGTFGGNLEVVARKGDRLVHYWRTAAPPFAWSGPFQFATGVSGAPGFIQGRFGTTGNFEVVVPLVGGGLGHFWRNNDDPALPWTGPTATFGGSGRFSGAALVQGTFGSPGNLEVVAVVGDRLCHFWRDSASGAWSSATEIDRGCSGGPALIQGAFGSPGNFELVVPRAGGRLAHYWRNNSDPALPWSSAALFGASGHSASAVSLVQSTFGSPGNLEVVARQDDGLFHYWRDSGPAFNWSNPGAVAEDCVLVHVKILTAPNVAIDTSLANMHTVYATQGLRVLKASTESLNLPLLNSPNVGSCVAGSTTSDQNSLFSNRNGVRANEIVVYFVLSTVPALNGCAASPANEPGAIVAQGASQWTVGHECGHDLGLFHVTGEPCSNPSFVPTSLMTGCGTSRIAGTPTISATEGSTMRGSNLSVRW